MQQLPKDRTQLRILLRRADAMATLVNHPGFQELIREIDRKEERERKGLFARAFSGAPVDQREFDYLRGLLQGMRYLAQAPFNAQQVLELAEKEAREAAEAAEESREVQEWT